MSHVLFLFIGIMLELRDRIAAMEAALQNSQEIEIPGPVRQSMDHRFDKTDPEVEAAPAPTPAQEKGNPFDAVDQKTQFYDSIAAKFGLGILDEEDFNEYIVYNAFVTNLRICPVHLGTGKEYYVEHRSFLPNTPGAILREGIDKSGKSLGAAHLPLTGRNSIGIGDFERPQDMVWERMGNSGFWTHMKYEFEHEVNGVRKTFHWIRSRNNVLDDQGDLVLVEKDEHLVLAEYVGKGLMKWKKRGRLRIRVMDFGDSWEVVVLLSWASVIEVCDLDFVNYLTFAVIETKGEVKEVLAVAFDRYLKDLVKRYKRKLFLSAVKGRMHPTSSRSMSPHSEVTKV